MHTIEQLHNGSRDSVYEDFHLSQETYSQQKTWKTSSTGARTTYGTTVFPA